MKIFVYIYYFFRSVALRGVGNTLRLLQAEAAYDKKFGIKTAIIKKSNSDEFYHYQGAGYLALLGILKIVFEQTSGFDFVDIGCGKGRAVFAAEFCGYNTATGIELHEELVALANENLKTYRFKRKESDIRFITANALDYAYKNRPTVYFFFNPFSEAIMEQVLSKIAAATVSETWFIYMNPLYKKPFTDKNMLPVNEFKTGKYTEAVIYRLPGSA